MSSSPLVFAIVVLVRVGLWWPRGWPGRLSAVLRRTVIVLLRMMIERTTAVGLLVLVVFIFISGNTNNAVTTIEIFYQWIVGGGTPCGL